ncbi:DUF924 family protein [Rhizobiaceae bacterium BDR2-2]|uniref:DUF924 family protein n=1 Tax=Ectorhizobium quercum TaxID=2965071 RepID=A0AAE3N378_9HYPH|nr:DUF924 family protein [Ectorhizobium quercum]MCX8999356.1 DUF924 family protein [Ectorhizobium quercum]
MTVPADALAVTRFWREAGAEKWFTKDEAFDDAFRSLCADLHMAAARRAFESWLDHPESALALLLLLDQFPRNCFRDTGHMYATDPLARHYSRRALALGHDRVVEPELRVFFYLPLTHSEDLADQEEAVKRNEPQGGPALEAAIDHRDIIARFGRFPHRNPILGRETTPEERRFLDEGGFAG